MKTNAIIRIILFSLAILILLGILIAGLGIKFFMFDTKLVTTSENKLPIASDGMTTQTVADSSVIRDIEVDWVAGTVILEPDENAETITISETYMDNAKHRMVVEQSGNKLKIRYCEDTITFPSFGLDINFSKDLIITVPKNWFCQSFEVDAASANLRVLDMKISEVEMDTASGVCEFVNCDVDKLDMDSASGDIRFSGALKELDFDGASANCHLELTNVPNQISMDGMSGDLDLTLPQDAGFTLSVDAISGNFQSDFPFTVSGKNYVCGDGHCRISFGGISGDVNIKKHATASESAPSQGCSDPNCTDTSHNHQILYSNTQTHHSANEHH